MQHREKYRAAPPKDGPPSEIAAPGFHLFPDMFADIEPSLLESALAEPPDWENYGVCSVKNYGPSYNLPMRRFLFGPSAPRGYPMPRFATEVILPRVRGAMPLLKDYYPNQVTTGLYNVLGKTHIFMHNDGENGELSTAVVGVCLGARCTMTLLLRKEVSGLEEDVKRDVVLPKGAMYVMSGDSMLVWEHGIYAGKTEGTRVALTFRDVTVRIENGPRPPLWEEES